MDHDNICNIIAPKCVEVSGTVDDKLRAHLQPIRFDGMKGTNAPVEAAPCRLSDIVDELKEALERQPATKDKEEKKALRKKKKQVMELEGYRDIPPPSLWSLCSPSPASRSTTRCT